MFKIKSGQELVTKSIRMPEDLAAEMEALTEEYNVSFSSLVLQCLRYALDNMDAGENKGKAAATK